MLRYVKRNAERVWFERPADMPEALHRLLIERCIASAEEAQAFLHPGPEQLCDPFLLGGMRPAAERIRAAIAAGEPICVYGDYDVDGVCAASILLLWLKSRGADVRVYLPSRHAEGYGLNEAAVREIAGWARLMITVDCGVTGTELVALAKSLGLDVIVTDHHRPAGAEGGFALPDCPVIDPLLDGYPFPHLCGAGVAWKLVWALSGEMPMEYVDIAALATVADVVPLTGENRAVVRMGLERMNRRPRPGIAALRAAAGVGDRPVTSACVAFQLAPRLNAGGRMGSAMRSLELVTAPDEAAARPLAEELERENARRRDIEQAVLAGAEAQLAGFDFVRHRALILAGKDWNPGVIGLAASRLVEKYNYPVILLADQGGRMTGSCRSIEGVDIHAALTGCAAHLERFGGHRQAAGLTLVPEKLPDFIEAMDRWLEAHVGPDAYIPSQAYDAEIGLDAVTPDLIAALEGLQPTGFGNPAPVFRAKAAVVEARAVGMEGAHLKLTLAQNGRRIDGIGFRKGDMADGLCEQLCGGGACEVDALFAPKLNEYMGRVSPQLELRELKPPSPFAQLEAKLGDEAGLQCDFLTEVFYNGFHSRAPVQEIAPVDARMLSEWANERPQGLLVLVSDLASAGRLLRWIEPARADVFFGALPEDPRAFNAVCVCPPVKPVPAGYRRAVLMGAPEECLGALPAACGVFRVDERPGWMDLLPDIDRLREAWRALAALSKRPLDFRGMRQLAGRVSDDSGLDRIAATASILAVADMGLFCIEPGGGPRGERGRIARLDRRKADPEDSAFWRALQRWRRGIL